MLTLKTTLALPAQTHASRTIWIWAVTVSSQNQATYSNTANQGELFMHITLGGPYQYYATAELRSSQTLLVIALYSRSGQVCLAG